MSNPRYAIPTHPQPGIWETTIAEVGDTVVTHADIEEILARPRWSLEGCKARVEANLRKTHRLKPLPGDGGGKVYVPKPLRAKP